MNAAPRLWLTYAWKDNDRGNVDHVVSKIREAGIEVLLDREELVVGRRLWSQIDKSITNPEKTDAWAIYVTQNALESEPCQEELSYALDRALRTRGSDFPIIGIFNDALPRELIPSSIATRLYVNLQDPSWVDRIKNGLVGTPLPKLTDPGSTVAELCIWQGRYFLVAHPRIGSWPTGFVAVEPGLFSSNANPEEKRANRINLTRFEGGEPGSGGMMMLGHGEVSLDGVKQDIFTLGGPFDKNSSFAVELPPFSGRVAIGGLSGKTILNFIWADITVPNTLAAPSSCIRLGNAGDTSLRPLFLP